MSFVYRRRTHTRDGRYLRVPDHIRARYADDPHSWIVHMLHPKKYMTVMEVFNEARHYHHTTGLEEQNPPPSDRLILADVLQGLGALIEQGCIGVRKQGVATTTVHVNVPIGAEDILELAEEGTGVVQRISRFVDYLRALNKKITPGDDEPPGTVVPFDRGKE